MKKKPDETGFEQSLRFDAILKKIQHHDPGLVFDIGCGSGYLGSRIKKWKPTVVLHGCDIYEIALDRAKPHFDNAMKVDLDRQEIPVSSGQYDAVFCSDVIELVYDVQHVLAEIQRILKPGKAGLLTVPNLVYWRYRLDLLQEILPIPADDECHLHQFTRDSMSGKIEIAALKITSVSGCRAVMPWLAEWKPSVFSDTLIFEVMKQ